MYRLCTTEKTIRQQRSVEECLLDAMQKQYYEEITVKALCEQAGITRRIFYRLFDTKDDVLYALIDHTLMEYTESSFPDDGNPVQVMEEVRNQLLFWLDKKLLLDVLEKNNQMTLLIDRVIYHATYHDVDTIRVLGLTNNPHGRQLVLYRMTGGLSLVIDWHKRGFQESLDEMAEIQFSLMTTPHISLAK